jgi:hypothetical protein
MRVNDPMKNTYKVQFQEELTVRKGGTEEREMILVNPST